MSEQHSPRRRTKLHRLVAGKCLGISPDLMQLDDEVWLLADLRTPLLLRPKPGSNKYALVGEIYLPDCVNGEMVNEELKSRVLPVHIV